MLCSNPNHPYEKNLIQPKPETLPVTVQFERLEEMIKKMFGCVISLLVSLHLSKLCLIKLNLKKKNYGSFPSTKELDNFASSCLSNL